jgi:hypothetical protein
VAADAVLSLLLRALLRLLTRWRFVSTGDDVARQLSADYPQQSLGWVRKLTWAGPEEIPLTQVDFSHRKTWNAWGEPQRVSKIAAKITRRAKQGRRIKPVVTVITPDSGKNEIIDGHHRSLAYRKLNEPVWGYTAETDSDTGPWDEFHALQRHAGPGTSEFAAKLESAPPASVTHGTNESHCEIGSQRAVWLVWEHDREHAQNLADSLQQALADSVDARDIAERWADIVEQQGPGSAESFVLSLAPQIQVALETVLGPAWVQAWELGERSARQQVSA